MVPAAEVAADFIGLARDFLPNTAAAAIEAAEPAAALSARLPAFSQIDVAPTPAGWQATVVFDS